MANETVTPTPNSDPWAVVSQTPADQAPVSQTPASQAPVSGASDPWAVVSQTAAPHVGPNGQPNPNNVYAAAPEENTPEGAAKALAARQAAHPIISGIGLGAESLLQPFAHPIDTVENLVKQSIPAYQLYTQTKQAYPLIQQYEKARAEGKTVWQSIADVNAYAGKQDAAHQQLEQAIAEYKKNPTQTTVKRVTQLAGNVALLLAGGEGATMEADAPAVAAETEAPVAAVETEAPVAATATETAAVPKSAGIIGKVKNFANQVRKGETIAQPAGQSAVREGVQSSVETTNANAAKAEAAAVPKPVDKFPVSIEHDEDGNVLNVDGRHRVVEAWERGDKTIPVTTKLADGATEVIEQAPQAVANKMGLGNTVEEAKAALENTDANQPYRAGNGKPRTPVYETPTPKISSDVTPVNAVKVPEATEPLTANSSNTIVDDHLDALEQQEKAAYKKVDEAAGFDVKALKEKLETDEYNKKQLGSSDPDKTGRLIEAINDSKDRIAEAEQKMKAAGIDPDAADALHKRGMAGQDFRKSLLKNTKPDGSINIKGLWNDTKALRNSEYGDRLEQWFGSKEAADAYVSKLSAAQKAGTQAMKRQAFAKQILWGLGGIGASTALGITGYEAFH